MALTPQEFSAKYSTDEALTAKAFELLQTGKTLLLGISGKIASGKDTVAGHYTASVAGERYHDAFGRALKDEIEQIITYAKQDRASWLVASRIAYYFHVPIEQASHVAGILTKAVHEEGLTSAWEKTESSRSALQYWGTDVRRAQNDLYWVERLAESLIEAIVSEKYSLITITDARFLDEVVMLRDLGGFVVRLKVSLEEQKRRIKHRDGIEADEKALTHRSETALDSHENNEHFDLIIDTTNCELDAIVATIKEKVAHGK